MPYTRAEKNRCRLTGGGGEGGDSEQMSPRYVAVHLYYNSHSRDDMLSMAVVTQTSHQRMHEKSLDVSVCPCVGRGYFLPAFLFFGCLAVRQIYV